jgi:integrase
MYERAVHRMIKEAAEAAGVNADVSPHWLRHAHGSHAIERGATLPQVQQTLGHGNIATTSGYPHARPDDSSGAVPRSGSVSSMKMRKRRTPHFWGVPRTYGRLS